jgi:hypothetical protein
MSINYTFEHNNDLLTLKATGKDINTEQIIEYGMAILGIALANRCYKILLDETDLQYSLGTFETFKSATYISENIPHNVRIAIVCRPENYDSANFRETVAVNRGLTIKVFTMYKNAENWLLDS